MIVLREIALKPSPRTRQRNRKTKASLSRETSTAFSNYNIRSCFPDEVISTTFAAPGPPGKVVYTLHSCPVRFTPQEGQEIKLVSQPNPVARKAVEREGGKHASKGNRQTPENIAP